MSRRKRIVIPGLPHHITQRGVQRRNVFFRKEDYKVYLQLLSKYSTRYNVEVLSYSLMTNHVHHLLVPYAADSLRWTLQLTHKKYAEYINSRHGWSGHLWQQRFYSSVVDENFFWTTVRYIEQNPVIAGIVAHPADYEWSSAPYHCGVQNDGLVTRKARWVATKSKVKDWKAWIAEEEDSQHISQLTKNTYRDLPTGSDAFLSELEHQFGVQARSRPPGRPKNR